MCTLYLDQQGAHLGRKGHQLTLQDKDGEIRYFPLEQIDRVMVYGQVQITTAALAALLDRGVPTTLLTQRGWMHGHLLANCGGQVRRRARQYELLRHAEQAIPVAVALVTAKLRNQRWLLRILGNRQAATEFASYIQGAKQAKNLDTLRGIEGSAARVYFSAFPALLEGTPFAFPGRRRRPPTDPVNSLLSLGYTLLLSELRNALQGYGLDTFAGVFHASDGGQPSCALDLMEPLRCLVDRLVIRLVRHTFTPEDFQIEDDGACLLKDGQRGKFYKAWEELLNSRTSWEGEQHSYRAIIQTQAGKLAKHLDDPSIVFRPLALSGLGR